MNGTTLLIIQIVAAFLLCLGYGMINNIPKRYIMLASGVGACARVLTYFVIKPDVWGFFLSTMLATMFITLMSHIFSRVLKTATTVFIVPGIMSFAPGGATYEAITAFINSESEAGMAKLGEVAAVAVGIALGIFIIDLIFTGVANRRKKRLAKRAQNAVAADEVFED